MARKAWAMHWGRWAAAFLLVFLWNGMSRGQQSPGRAGQVITSARTNSSPNSPALKDPNVLAAEDFMKQKNFRKAIEALELVVRFEPRSDPEVYVMLATCRLNLGERNQAIEVCARGIEAHPASVRLQAFYLDVLRTVGTRQELKTKLQASLKEKPQSVIYMKGLGEALLEEDPLDPRIEPLVKTAADALPRDPEAHYLYGQWACLNDRPQLSVRELNKALALTPPNDQARMQIYTFLGIAYDHLDRPADADPAFRKAYAFNQRLAAPNPGSAMQYADFLLKRSREAEAQDLISWILNRTPSFAPAHLERAKFSVRQRKMEEALAEGELALRYAGADTVQQRAAHSFLAKTCFALGRTEEAQFHQKWLETH